MSRPDSAQYQCLNSVTNPPIGESRETMEVFRFTTAGGVACDEKGILRRVFCPLK